MDMGVSTCLQNNQNAFEQLCMHKSETTTTLALQAQCRIVTLHLRKIEENILNCIHIRIILAYKLMFQEKHGNSKGWNTQSNQVQTQNLTSLASEAKKTIYRKSAAWEAKCFPIKSYRIVVLTMNKGLIFYMNWKFWKLNLLMGHWNYHKSLSIQCTWCDSTPFREWLALYYDSVNWAASCSQERSGK